MREEKERDLDTEKSEEKTQMKENAHHTDALLCTVPLADSANYTHQSSFARSPYAFEPDLRFVARDLLVADAEFPATRYEEEVELVPRASLREGPRTLGDCLPSEVSSNSIRSPNPQSPRPRLVAGWLGDPC